MQILRSSSIYLLANFLTKGISILLIPILTKYLSPENYGQILLFSSLMVFFNPALYCGGIDLISIDYFKGQDAFRKTLNNCNTTVFYSCIATFFLFLIISPFIADFFQLPVWAIIILPLVCLLSYYLELLLLLLRYEGKHTAYLKATMTKTLVEVGVTIFCLIILKSGWFSRVLGIIVGFIISFFFLLKIIPLAVLFKKFDHSSFVDTIKRGAPFIIAQFLIIAFLTVDKLFIPKYFNAHELGLYGIAFQISSLLAVFATSFASVLQPIQYKLGSDLNAGNKEKLIHIIYVFVSILFVCSIVLILIAPLVYNFFVHPQYQQSLVWVKYLVIAGFFSGCNAFLVNIIRQKGSGKQLIALHIYPLLLLAVLLFILPHYFHIEGIMYAYIVVNFFITIITIKKVKILIGASNVLFIYGLKKFLIVR